MDIRELNRDQLAELKQHVLFENAEYEGRALSWDDLAKADSIVSDDEIVALYDGVIFTDDDFSSGMDLAAEVSAFVACAMLGEHEIEPMTENDATIAIDEWTKEGLEYPDGMTPAMLANEWNRQMR